MSDKVIYRVSSFKGDGGCRGGGHAPGGGHAGICQVRGGGGI